MVHFATTDLDVGTYSPFSGSPLDVAVVYGVVSAAWILVSDRLVAATIADPALANTVQTAKGWLFVVGSAILIFGLVRHGQRSMEQTNERLDRALRQTSVLHRILRHNLRNSCNVIAGNTELIAAHVETDGGEGEVATDAGADAGPDSEECLETIREQTEQLVTITEKTRELRDLVLEEEPEQRIDLADVVEDAVASARERYPTASFQTDAPAGLALETDPRIKTAIDELLENAVVHSDRADPAVSVELRQRADGTVALDVADDGPGMPEMERAVLEEGMESPMFHSEGLGLWIARTVVHDVGGDIRIVDNEPRGTVVRIQLPP